MPSESERSAAVGTGLRIAVAAVCCLYVGEMLEIGQTSLSVYTAFLVMALFPITSFQKGFERFVGRALGLAYGVAVIWLARENWLLYLVLIVLGQMVACYIYLSGRLAYAALMGAIFIGVMATLGVTAPATASPYFQAAVIQLLLGEALAFFVNLITGAENTLAIEIGGQPLFPLRRDWLNTAAMLSIGQVATMLATLLLDLPVASTMISALIIGIVPGGWMEEGKKAWQRTLGALLGGGYALVAILLLALQPKLVVLAMLIAIILFAGTYLTKTSKKNSYAYLQMGMVAPMVMIGEHGEIGTVEKAVQRVIGICIGMVAAGLVTLIWPHTPVGQTAAPVAPIAHPTGSRTAT
jgi:uncharacterized membrane protein YccC